MSYAEIEIEYTKIRVGTSPNYEYIMKVAVDSVLTEPVELDTCLVVKQGDSTADESLQYVGDVSQVVTVASKLAALPSVVDRFQSNMLGALGAAGVSGGDVITIAAANLPTVWTQLLGCPVTDFTATVIAGITDPFDVEVTPDFPGFARDLIFGITGVNFAVHLPGTDGVANRDYTTTGTFFLAAEHCDSYGASLVNADSKYASLRAEAQSLVDELNSDNYTDVVDEVYD